jgi:hypothetical protein
MARECITSGYAGNGREFVRTLFGSRCDRAIRVAL